MAKVKKQLWVVVQQLTGAMYNDVAASDVICAASAAGAIRAFMEEGHDPEDGPVHAMLVTDMPLYAPRRPVEESWVKQE